jgi:hypothetical protein
MGHTSIIHRYLDPGDALAEVLFGLIMVLTFTVGTSVLSGAESFDSRELLVAAVGCNLAWGIIDAVLFVLNGLFYRSQQARFYRGVRNAASETEALAALQAEFGLEDEPIAVDPEDRLRLYQSMLVLSAHAKPARVRLRRQDIVAAFIVFLLVSATALPGAIPFLFIDDPYVALRVSNFVLVALLFLVGHWWAKYTDARPLKVGMTVMILGLAMVFVAIALGG